MLPFLNGVFQTPKKKPSAKEAQEEPDADQKSKMVALPLPPTTIKGTKRRTLERRIPSVQQEECNPGIDTFVNQVCELGVSGLRKMFVEQLAMQCPPRSKCSAFEDNPNKNRYLDIVCLETSRVILQKETPDETDYIHANWVKFDKHDRVFIATQVSKSYRARGTPGTHLPGLLANDSAEQLSYNCKPNQGGGRWSPKCHQYWPEKAGDYAKFGSIQIINKKVESDDKFSIYTLDCVMENCSDGHIVKMIQMTSWPDKGLPLSGTMVLRMIRCITTVDPLAIGPVVVHCSAGISRTGTIILIDVILQRLFRNQLPVDLTELFKNLRLQRASCIQREGQFVFLVSTVLDYIRARIPNKFNEKIDKFKAEFKAANMCQN